MSRVGKIPVGIPASVKVNLQGQEIFVEGPKGKLSFTALPHTTISLDGDSMGLAVHGLLTWWRGFLPVM